MFISDLTENADSITSNLSYDYTNDKRDLFSKDKLIVPFPSRKYCSLIDALRISVSLNRTHDTSYVVIESFFKLQSSMDINLKDIYKKVSKERDKSENT